jgi:hypothetical protein
MTKTAKESRVAPCFVKDTVTFSDAILFSYAEVEAQQEKHMMKFQITYRLIS